MCSERKRTKRERERERERGGGMIVEGGRCEKYLILVGESSTDEGTNCGRNNQRM